MQNLIDSLISLAIRLNRFTTPFMVSGRNNSNMLCSSKTLANDLYHINIIKLIKNIYYSHNLSCNKIVRVYNLKLTIIMPGKKRLNEEEAKAME
jgi:hypothetical protein